MSGVWTNVVKSLWAAFAMAATGLIGSVVTTGGLPQWISRCIAWIGSLLALRLDWPLWTVILIVLFMGSLSAYLLCLPNPKITEQEKEIEGLRLKLEQAELKCANLITANAELTRQAIPAPIIEPILSRDQLDMLNILAACENDRVAATISNIVSISKLQRVRALSLMDDLIVLKYVVKIRMAYDFKYQLSPSGRKLV